MRAESALRTISTRTGGPVTPFPVLNAPSSANPTFRSPASAVERVDDLVRRAMTFLESDREAALRCLCDASALLRSESPHPDANVLPASYTFRSGSLARWQIKRTLTYIEDNLGSKMAISDLADGVAVSKSHFCRAFKRSVGLSPMEYVTSRRVERAKLMMTSSREQLLTEIALACGFADQSHLNRSFRRWVGVSPGHWRRNNAEMGSTTA